MTPLQALVIARQAGVDVFFEDARLRFKSLETPPDDVLALLRQHRELLLEALGDPKWAGAWLDMVHALGTAHIDLDAVVAKRARRDQHRVPERLYWQAFDHVCHTRCRRKHRLCSACAQPRQRQWLHWPWLHAECRLERVDQ